MTADITTEGVRARFPHLFDKLPAPDIAAVLAVATPLVLDVGATVLRTDSPGGALYLIWSGALAVAIGGREAPVVRILLKPGAICGDVSFIDRGPPTADVWADEASVVLKIEGDDFDDLAVSNPRVARAFLHALCEDLTARVRNTSNHLLAVTAQPTRHARPESSAPVTREGWPARAASSLFHR